MTTLADMKRKRSSAKGVVTRTATHIKTLQAMEVAKLDVKDVQKQLTNLEKSEESFYTAHETIADLEGDRLDAAQHETELADQIKLICNLKSIVQELLDSHKANQALCRLDGALRALELGFADGYDRSLDSRLQDTQQLEREFRDTCTVGMTMEDGELRTQMDDRASRIMKIARARDELLTPPTPRSSGSGSAAAEIMVKTSSLKLKLPTFNGDIMRWKDYWELFSDLLNKEPDLTDREKCCHLIASMSTPAVQEKAEEAVANSADYAEAVGRLKQVYDRNRLVHAHHVRELDQPDTIRDNREDLERIIARMERSIRGMKSTKGYTVEQLITALVEAKMVDGLTKQWRKFSSRHQDPPKVDVLLTFFKEQLKATPESSSTSNRKEKEKDSIPNRSKPQQQSRPKTILQLHQGDKCPLCGLNHALYLCSQYRDKSPTQRKDFVRGKGLCFNCLSSRHRSNDCSSRHRCKECSGLHHTTLHIVRPATTHIVAEDDTVALTTNMSKKADKVSYVLPRTAAVVVQGRSLRQKVRAQFDSGASVTLISRRLATTLRAAKVPHSAQQIAGIAGVMYSSHRVDLTLLGNDGEEVSVRAQVVEHIPTTNSPSDVRKLQSLPFLKSLKLADPNYTAAARIDLLMDMGASNACYTPEVITCNYPGLRAINSIFGWTIGGTASDPLPEAGSDQTCLRVSACSDSLDELLQQYWAAEQLPQEDTGFTPEEQQALDVFKDTTTRDEDGRYRVSLPKKVPTPKLGHSRESALRRYSTNERSLKRRGVWDQFQKVIDEYGGLRHSEPIPEEELSETCRPTYYLPMHGVSKSSSTTTKLRAVWDASAKSSNGKSLNDILLPGPNMYPPLTSVINRFRRHSIGMTADIGKMFREVGLNRDDQDLHRYLHKGADGKIHDHRMTRLTFGVTSSPYLATQVLRQMASDYKEEFPLASRILQETFYVDDCLTGAEDLQEAQAIRDELNSLLSKGCMTLRKWRSSSSELLETIPEELKESSDLQLTAVPGESLKALGLHWNNQTDTLHVATPSVDFQQYPTKRYVASIAARTFDVLGWFTPATLLAKLLLQESWIHKIAWDAALPPSMNERWKTWAEDLPGITRHPIARSMGRKVNAGQVLRQLHGYSDASKLAYGGVIYLRTLHSDATVTIDLVTSKSRVAPLKELTVPRLELCGALLLARLLRATAKDLDIPAEAIFAWCDSSAVLGWLHKASTSLPVYVAHRVEKINLLIPANIWRYVETVQNPADLLSRGVPTKDLLTRYIWWKGPPWLGEEPGRWPRRPDINLERELPEMRPSVLVVRSPGEEYGLWCSSFPRLVRVTAWLTRFLGRLKKKVTPSGILTLPELHAAKTLILQQSQAAMYGAEISTLKSGQPLSNGHSLSALSPYLDREGILRVGGRLQKSNLPTEICHPIILHPRSHIVQLLVLYTHESLLHAGPSTVMATMAVHYHIPKIKRLLKKISRSCVKCQRAYARTSRQLMGELPADRVRPARPFAITGLDFAGPFMVKRGNPRKPTLVKVYVCVLICFTTRAVHFEVVSDLTTSAFLAALSRFVSRRGLPSNIYSDNGSNFIGAQSELQKIIIHLKSVETQESITNWAAQRSVRWHFTPARAPHFGGLWEAAVRSMKTVLKKTVGGVRLTYEELNTIVIEAEAVVNSRPLVPLDSLAEDAVEPLTPGHFLVGGPLAALPVLPDCDTKLSNLHRWNLVQRLSHDVWVRWKLEYLLTLQRRGKWKRSGPELRVGDIVLVKDNDAFQGSWPMGRITDVYPGTDHQVRVVDIRQKDKVYRRPVHNIVRLLGEDDEASSPRGEDVRA